MAPSGRFLLEVSYASSTNRLLKGATVSATANGSAASLSKDGSKTGVWQFTLPANPSRIDFTLRIPTPPEATVAGTLLTLTQQFTLAPGTGAAKWIPAGGTWPAPDLHPRVTLVSATGVTGGTGGTLRIGLDLTFLDLTSALAPTTAAPQGGAVIRHFAGVDLHNCQLRVLERTGTPDMPVTWLAFTTQALIRANTKSIGMLLFFRPSGNAYGNTADDAKPAINPLGVYLDSRMLRYLRDPLDPQRPFFIRSSGLFNIFGDFGFLKQLDASGKPLLFLYPIPSVSQYGGLRQKQMVPSLDAILRALWGDRTVTRQTQGVRRSRLAIAGFSFGGGAASSAILNNTSAVDEAYLFDANQFSSNAPQFESWFRLGGKKLRMIAGGFQDDAMFATAARLADPDATVKPTNKAFWQSDPLYRAAVSTPGRVDAFTPSGSAAPPGSLSARSNVFFVGSDATNTGITLEVRFTDARGQLISQRQSLALYSHAEAASVSLHDTSVPKRLPITSPRAFTAYMNELVLQPDPDQPSIVLDRIKELRHEWVGAGGEDSGGRTDRGATFKGYLQLCLEGSGF